jgi:hypothetical protein
LKASRAANEKDLERVQNRIIRFKWFCLEGQGCQIFLGAKYQNGKNIVKPIK